MTKVTLYLTDAEEQALIRFAGDCEKAYEEHDIPVNPSLGNMTTADAAALALRIGLQHLGYLDQP